MTVHGRHRASRRSGPRRHLGLAVVAGGIGIAAATVTGQDVAWAETGPSDAGPQSTDGTGAADTPHRAHLGALARAVKSLQPHGAASTAPPADVSATPEAAAGRTNVTNRSKIRPPTRRGRRSFAPSG